jgi:hypothetical protein
MSSTKSTTALENRVAVLESQLSHYSNRLARLESMLMQYQYDRPQTAPASYPATRPRGHFVDPFQIVVTDSVVSDSD